MIMIQNHEIKIYRMNHLRLNRISYIKKKASNKSCLKNKFMIIYK